MAELKRLHTAWDVDRHIVLDSADKIVLVRFSNYENPPDSAVFHGIRTNEPPFKRVRAEGELDDSPDNGHDSVAEEDVSAAAAEHYLRTQQIDALLVEVAPKVRKYCVIYVVDTNKVTEFNAIYELGHDRDPFAVMFFYRNAHIRVDVGTGNINKINFFAFEDMDDFIPIINAAYRAGKLGKNMASSDRKFSTVSIRR